MMRTTPPKKIDAAAAMLEARTWLAEHVIPHHYLPPYQLKIGPINFWPGKGTITVDGEGQRRAEKGLAGLEMLLIAVGMLKAAPAQPAQIPRSLASPNAGRRDAAELVNLNSLY